MVKLILILSIIIIFLVIISGSLLFYAKNSILIYIKNWVDFFKSQITGVSDLKIMSAEINPIKEIIPPTFEDQKPTVIFKTRFIDLSWLYLTIIFSTLFISLWYFNLLNLSQTNKEDFKNFLVLLKIQKIAPLNEILELIKNIGFNNEKFQKILQDDNKIKIELIGNVEKIINIWQNCINSLINSNKLFSDKYNDYVLNSDKYKKNLELVKNCLDNSINDDFFKKLNIEKLGSLFETSLKELNKMIEYQKISNNSLSTLERRLANVESTITVNLGKLKVPVS